MASKIRLKLEEALREKRLIRFARRFEDSCVRGYVLDIGPRFFLLSLVSDRVRFDGFECFRVADIRAPVAEPYAEFAERALKMRRERKPRRPRVTLASLEQLLLTASRAFPVVTIHREEVDPDVCWIGRVTGISGGSVSLLEISPDATWEQTPSEHRLSEITRVNFGGDYENALTLVGGTPARCLAIIPTRSRQ